MEARVGEGAIEAIVAEIHAVNGPVRRFQNTVGQMMSDKAVDA